VAVIWSLGVRSYSQRVRAFESVSTWRQPLPPEASAERTALLSDVAARVAGLGPGRLRVGVDGLTGAGKTSFGHELAAALRGLGRPTLRASMDDFKNPWREAAQAGHDRITGEGYYRNAYDILSARDLLLGPAGPAGSGEVVLCAHDPLTGADHRTTTVLATADAVLIVDSVFAFRPEYNDCWEYRIWLDVDADHALRRGVARRRDGGHRGSHPPAPRPVPCRGDDLRGRGQPADPGRPHHRQPRLRTTAHLPCRHRLTGISAHSRVVDLGLPPSGIYFLTLLKLSRDDRSSGPYHQVGRSPATVSPARLTVDSFAAHAAADVMRHQECCQGRAPRGKGSGGGPSVARRTPVSARRSGHE
jgi:uridine kinase